MMMMSGCGWVHDLLSTQQPKVEACSTRWLRNGSKGCDWTARELLHHGSEVCSVGVQQGGRGSPGSPGPPSYGFRNAPFWVQVSSSTRTWRGRRSDSGCEHSGIGDSVCEHGSSAAGRGHSLSRKIVLVELRPDYKEAASSWFRRNNRGRLGDGGDDVIIYDFQLSSELGGGW
ncbi:hypothetical protein F0562_010640 [Nyssa sinensis]|uniref:Uncharacterized protein n=1 Tax=Nyssa sinensis TaxID=561372 RepID=A0A5J5A2D2_9ASTE|nr:hypothetical protein F0562_010640 [Nyssa sinensis]